MSSDHDQTLHDEVAAVRAAEAAVGLPVGAGIDGLIRHHRGNAGMYGALQAMMELFAVEQRVTDLTGLLQIAAHEASEVAQVVTDERGQDRLVRLAEQILLALATPGPPAPVLDGALDARALRSAAQQLAGDARVEPHPADLEKARRVVGAYLALTGGARPPAE